MRVSPGVPEAGLRLLERAGLADPLALLSEFALDGDGLRGFAEGAVRNTDDNLLLEFSSPRYIGQRLSASGYARLIGRRAEPLALVHDIAGRFANRAEALRSLALYRAAKEATRRAMRQEDDEAVATLRGAHETLPSHGRARLELADRLRVHGVFELHAGALSAAHSDGDIETLIAAYERCAEEMAEAGA